MYVSVGTQCPETADKATITEVWETRDAKNAEEKQEDTAKMLEKLKKDLTNLRYKAIWIHGENGPPTIIS
jgi:hypothetical protein